MPSLHIAETLVINAAASIVADQFSDVSHHAQTGLHRGVVFEVLSETTQSCRYQQTTSLGPVKLKQEISLDRTQSNPQVHRIDKGQFSGGSITFSFEEVAADTTRVTAVVATELTGINKLLGPVLRRNVASALRTALAEDKADIESGSYVARA